MGLIRPTGQSDESDFFDKKRVAAVVNLVGWVNRPVFPNPNAGNMEGLFDEKISPLIHNHIIEKTIEWVS